MHKYFIKTPWWARRIFSSYVWHIPTREKIIYLSFDDGPHPTITPWVLNELEKHHAKATFFCIGKNVKQYTNVYNTILKKGHSVGNHTYHHLNGWKTSCDNYLTDVHQACALINSNLFRPPYGKIKSNQAKGLRKAMANDCATVIMWDVLSADFDTTITPQQCINNVLKNVRPGSVVVFHDSEKAFNNLQHTLPLILTSLKNDGYRFEEIVMKCL